MKMRILLLVAAAAAATACTRNVEPRFASLRIDTLLGTAPVQIGVSYCFRSIENAAESPALAEIQRSDIAGFFGLEHFEGTFSEAVDRSLREFADEYLPDEGAVPPAFVADWYVSVSSDCELLDSLMTFVVQREGYLGGAHGYASTEYRTYRLSDGRRLALADRFDAAACAAMRAALAEKLFDAYAGEAGAAGDAACESPEEALQCLGFFPDSFDLTENFRLLPDGGVLFRYNPYEIACYAAGPVEVVFTGEEIARLCAGRP